MRPAKFLAILLPLALCAGCQRPGAAREVDAGTLPTNTGRVPGAPDAGTGERLPPPDAGNTMTILLADGTGEFCNGEVMDSSGYRRTLTRQVTITLEGTQADRIRSVITAATSGMCRTVVEPLEIKVEGGTARIPAIDGWAGASIVMCSCQPEVEVNLLRMPGISRVVWEEAGSAP